MTPVFPRSIKQAELPGPRVQDSSITSDPSLGTDRFLDFGPISCLMMAQSFSVIVAKQAQLKFPRIAKSPIVFRGIALACHDASPSQ